MKYTHLYGLNTCDFDVLKVVRTTSWMHFLQDISTRHFEKVLRDHGEEGSGFWVIVEWALHLEDITIGLEDVVVKTKPTYFRKFIAYRTYEMTKQDGTTIGTATSKWAYLDGETRRQGQIPQRYNAWFEVPLHAEKPSKPERFLMASASTFQSAYTVQDSDIDINNHVNNVAYIRIALDSIYANLTAFRNIYKVSTLNVSYKKEVSFGEVTHVHTQWVQKSDVLMTSQVITNASDEICFICEIQWKPFT